MNATILSEVLFGISSKSRFAQGLDIEFETKSGYKCSTHMWLYPQYYHGGFNHDHIEFSGHQNDFGVLFQIEKEANFSKWTRISFRDSDENANGRNDNVIICLSSDTYGPPHRSHYSGHLFVSWMDYVDKGHKERAISRAEAEHEKTLRIHFNKLKKWMSNMTS